MTIDMVMTWPNLHLSGVRETVALSTAMTSEATSLRRAMMTMSLAGSEKARHEIEKKKKMRKWTVDEIR